MITMAEEQKLKNIMSFFFVCLFISAHRSNAVAECNVSAQTMGHIIYIYTQYYYVTVSKVYDGLYRKVETEEE